MSTSSESSFEEQEEFTVANVAVLNKYKLAGELANSKSHFFLRAASLKGLCYGF